MVQVALSTYTSLLASLVHPTLMVILVCTWLYTACLGYGIRFARLKRASNNASVPLIQNDHRHSKTSLHHRLAGPLLFATVGTTLLGMWNTFQRTGRLFPGPHFYGGLGFILMLSANAALVPYMKTFSLVRLSHTMIGTCALIVLVMQIPSGYGILRSLLSTFQSKF